MGAECCNWGAEGYNDDGETACVVHTGCAGPKPRLRQKQIGKIRESKRRGVVGEEGNDDGVVQEAEGAAARDLPLKSVPKTSHAVLNGRKIVSMDEKRSGHGDLSSPAGSSALHLLPPLCPDGVWARQKDIGREPIYLGASSMLGTVCTNILYAISPRNAHVCKLFVAITASNRLVCDLLSIRFTYNPLVPQSGGAP